MPKYHISKDGMPKPCLAVNACPLGGDAPHAEFPNVQEALAWSEVILAQANGGSFGGKESPLAEAAYVEVGTQYRELYGKTVEELVKREERAGALWESSLDDKWLSAEDGTVLLSISNSLGHVESSTLMARHPADNFGARLAEAEVKAKLSRTPQGAENLERLEHVKAENPGSRWAQGRWGFELIGRNGDSLADVHESGIIEYF